MKERIWLRLCILEAALILILGLALILSSRSILYVGESDVSAYLTEYPDAPAHVPEEGYVPDAKTAGAIGGPVVDKMTGGGFLGSVMVSYDPDDRLWMVTKTYFPYGGGFVIIEQDTGRILLALLHK